MPVGFPFMPQMQPGVQGMLPNQTGSTPDAQNQLGQQQFMPMPMIYQNPNQQPGF